ncbi:MAG: SH3 domain-containing protein, partial [Clostridia bacterium]|nr:SH3 domain-containing protein [Clostridia bacterium]
MRLTKSLVRMVAATLLIALMMSVMAPALAASYPYDTVSMDDVNLRKRASSSAVVLGKIKAGDPIRVLGKTGDWYKVEYRGETGYAMCVYVDGLDSSPDPSPDPSIQLNPPLAISTYPY